MADRVSNLAIAFAPEEVRHGQLGRHPLGDGYRVVSCLRCGTGFADVAARQEKPNLVATIEGDGPCPHLVLNGHMDVYPAGDEAQWTRPPLSGWAPARQAWRSPR